jgi:hypothetical protein
LIAIEPGQEIEINGFKIQAFNWHHRKINYFKFFGGDFLTGFKFTLSNLLRCPKTGPYYGFFLIAPNGLRIMNYSEGINPLLPTHEAKQLAEALRPEILIAGMQLTYEQDVARVVSAVGPQKIILYHPHKQLFEKMNIESSSPETFIENIRSVNPSVEILIAEPFSSFKLQK